jgi:polysaccharide biosynthesis protein PslA
MATALVIAAALLNFVAFFAKFNAEFSRVIFTAGLVVSALMMVGFRILLTRLVTARLGPSAINRLVIWADGPKIEFPHFYHIDAEEHGLSPDMNDPAALDRLGKYMRHMDQVIVSCIDDHRLGWSEVLKAGGVHGEVLSEFARAIGAIGIVHHDQQNVSTMLVSTGRLRMRSRATKRLFDLAVSGIALIVLSPLLLACAIAIKLDDRGPILFRQRRMGRGNQFFEIYKFRTMRGGDADGVRSASKADARVTRVGAFLRRTSLDELPQLVNVVRGEMSTIAARLPVA